MASVILPCCPQLDIVLDTRMGAPGQNCGPLESSVAVCRVGGTSSGRTQGPGAQPGLGHGGAGQGVDAPGPHMLGEGTAKHEASSLGGWWRAPAIKVGSIWWLGCPLLTCGVLGGGCSGKWEVSLLSLIAAVWTVW